VVVTRKDYPRQYTTTQLWGMELDTGPLPTTRRSAQAMARGSRSTRHVATTAAKTLFTGDGGARGHARTMGSIGVPGQAQVRDDNRRKRAGEENTAARLGGRSVTKLARKTRAAVWVAATAAAAAERR
jgi:hypothetical protein